MKTATHIPSVYIIILNWNGKEDTLKCLQSLSCIDYQNYHIVLVDNGSHDGLVGFLEQDENFKLTVLKNTDNVGFAEGCNIGIRFALSKRCDYVLLLNNDTIVNVSFLLKLVNVGEKHSDIGMLSPVIYYDKPSDRVWFYNAGIDWQNGFAYHDESDVSELMSSPKDFHESEYLPGCALLVKRPVIEELGLLDSRFFAYYEDVDWSLRCKKANWKTVVVTSSVIRHKLSSHQNSDFGNFLKYRNTILFLWKHSNPLHFLLRVKRHIYKALAEYSWDREEHYYSERFNPLDGIWAGLTGQYGAKRNKMPKWIKTMMFHTIRYWLWIFRFPYVSIYKSKKI